MEPHTCFDLFDELKTPYCPAPKIDPEVNLCAGSSTGDICSGDSGGGLVAFDHFQRLRKKLNISIFENLFCRNYVLLGVSSFNLGCNSSTVKGNFSFLFKTKKISFQVKHCRVSLLMLEKLGFSIGSRNSQQQ